MKSCQSVYSRVESELRDMLSTEYISFVTVAGLDEHSLMLHEDASYGRVQQDGQDAWSQDNGGAVAEASPSQEVCVVANVWLAADVLQAAQVPTGRSYQAPKKGACKQGPHSPDWF